MVKRYAPCHRYFDEWDEEGSSTCEQARGGEYVLYKTYKHEMDRLLQQIERLKKRLAAADVALAEAISISQ